MRAADNPFAVHRILRQRYRLTEEQWTSVLDRLEALRYRAAIVGAKGSGKTTLLEDLAPRLEARGHRVRLVRVDPARRRGPDLFSLREREMLLCDGAEQLSRVDWWGLRLGSRRCAGLVVTSHRVGLLPTLHRCATSPALLAELTAALGAPVQNAQCADLHERHGGNIRDAVRELYDEMSGR